MDSGTVIFIIVRTLRRTLRVAVHSAARAEHRFLSSQLTRQVL